MRVFHMAFEFAARLTRVKRLLMRLCSIVLASGLMSVLAPVAAQPSLQDIFQSTLACVLVEPLLADMQVEPLFIQNGTNCEPVVPDDSDQVYFSDSSCQSVVPFTATPIENYCGSLLNQETLGEGAGVSSLQWTLSPGSRLDVGARSLDGVVQPYLQRQIYQTIDTAGGPCELEMRIYANSPIPDSQGNSPSLLALHGGSWSARGFGFFGLELTIPHYVQQGFVVYAPFYRLLSDSEGSPACNQSDIASIVSDADAALDWIQENSATFGSSTRPVVFGQSAGAHLATSLLVNRANDVSGAVLLYPPTDFTDFALRAQQGFYSDEQGLGILERLIGMTAQEVDINASPVPENSFPIRIAEQGIEVPPVMIIHGMRDTLVESRQSTRLCDALNGQTLQAVDQEVETFPQLRKILACGEQGGSEVHLIREGQHALDVCFADFPLATDLCPSGSAASRAEVSQAIEEAVLFASLQAGFESADGPVSDQGNDDETQPTGSGGAFGAWLMVTFFLFGFYRRFTTSIYG